MMLHRHFEAGKEQKNITKLADVTPHKEEFVSEVFPPDEEAPKRRGRPKKQD